MFRLTAVFVLCLNGIPLAAQAGENLRVMAYNLTYFRAFTSFCTSTNNPPGAKEGWLRTVVDYVQPDLLVCNEVDGSSATAHGRILEQIGAHHVIFPEYEMGRRVAHMVTGESLDYVQTDEDFVMVKSICPESFDGQTLAEVKIRSNYEVTVVAVNSGDGVYAPAFPETKLSAGDLLVVAGRKQPLDEFVQLQ